MARRDEARPKSVKKYPGRMYGSGFGSPGTKPDNQRRGSGQPGQSRVRISAGSRVLSDGQTTTRKRRIPRTFGFLRKAQNSKQRLQTTLNPIRKRLVLIALPLLLVLGFVSFSGVEVQQVEYGGNNFLFYDESVYEAAVVSARSNMGPMRRSNILLFSSSQIEGELGGLSDVSQVYVKKDYWRRTVRIVVETEPPSVIWSSSGRQFVINADGFVEQSDSRIMSRQSAKEANIPYVEDKANSLSAELLASNGGQQAVSPQLISFMAEIYSLSLSTPRLTINNFEVAEIPQELGVIIDEFGAVRVSMNSGADARAQFKTLLGAAVTLDAASVDPEYIDVRVPGRAVYKDAAKDSQ